MSWTKRVEHPSELVQKGDEVKVMVLDVDAENKRISLGIKQTQDDPWPGISERLTPGVEVDGTVVRVQDKGVVVDLGDDIEGFVPSSHSGVEDANRLEEFYGAGQAVALRIIESDAANRRIVLEVTEEPTRRPQEELDAEKASSADAEEAAEGSNEPEAAAQEEAKDEPEASAEEAAESEDAEEPEEAGDESEDDSGEDEPEESEDEADEDEGEDEGEDEDEEDEGEDEGEDEDEDEDEDEKKDD
jgi:small subunit ribosomal protein S1